MKDSLGNTIYVGKSKSLKQRVKSYFRSTAAHTPKVKRLVSTIRDFDFIETDTEFEAFILEWQLIQERKPYFNRQMKTPKSFCYLVIPKNGEYRKIEVSTQLKDPASYHCFGPFSGRRTPERAIEGIKEMFKLQCSSPVNKGRPCLNYSLGSCRGLCLGGEALEFYDRILTNLIRLLRYHDSALLNEMEELMTTAAGSFEFEAAAQYRDYIHAIDALINKGKVVGFTEKNHRILIVEKLGENKFKLFLIMRTNILFSKTYSLQQEGTDDIRSSVMDSILTYFRMQEPAAPLKVDRCEIDKAHIIYRYLTNSNCSYTLLWDDWFKEANRSQLGQAIDKLLMTLEHHYS